MMYSTSSKQPTHAFLRSARLRFSRIVFSRAYTKEIDVGCIKHHTLGEVELMDTMVELEA
jgi:hypothetical protein